MKAYKVVAKTSIEGRYTSAIVGYSHSVTYKLGETTRPKRGHGPLCVFDSYVNANRFVNEREFPQRFEIFECIINKPRKNLFILSDISHKPFEFYPTGTVFASSVTLTKIASTLNSTFKKGS